MSDNIHWMQQALQLAHKAEEAGEVPVGAILVQNNQMLGEGWNQPIGTCDPTAHAEIVALRHAAKTQGNYRLLDTTLYVTLEPCIMCAGAILQSRIKRVVFGAYDPRAGAAGSVFNVFQAKEVNHRVDFMGGVLQQTCSELLKGFFQRKRQ